jgi:hypothetical protein
LTAEQPFVIKFDFAGQFFATEYSTAGKRAEAQVLYKYPILNPGSIHWIGPPKKTLKLLVDRLERFR